MLLFKLHHKSPKFEQPKIRYAIIEHKIPYGYTYFIIPYFCGQLFRIGNLMPIDNYRIRTFNILSYEDALMKLHEITN